MTTTEWLYAIFAVLVMHILVVSFSLGAMSAKMDVIAEDLLKRKE